MSLGTARRPQWTTSLRFWTWGAALFSLGLCLAITWMHFQQDESLRRAERIFENVREARIDLAKGFLNLTLSGDERSPFRQEEGLALLDQAINVLQGAESRISQDKAAPTEGAESGADFRKQVAEFRSLLAAWKQATGDARRELELRLRIAFHELELQAGRVDLANQRELRTLNARLDRVFGTTLAVAILLLSGICLGVYLAGRHERVAVEALRESEERLRLVGDNLPDGYVFQYVREADGSPRFTHISAGVERVHGVTAAEVLRDANCLLGQMDPGQQTAFAAAEAESARKLANFEMELRGQRRDGAVREIYVRSRPRHIGDGILLWDGFVVDVTERKRAEAALQENERRLAALFGNLPGMAYRCRNDRPWSMEFVSEGCLDLTGHSAAELTKNRTLAYADVIHPDDREMAWTEIQKALEGRQKFQLSYRIQTAGGETKWVWEQGVGVYSPAGKLLALEGFVMDVTAQRAAAATLAKYRLLSEHTRDIILFVRPQDGRIVEANHAAGAAYGYERAELLARSVYDLRPATACAAAAGQLAQAAEGWHLFETIHRCRDGRTFPVEISSHAARIEGENLLVNVVRDISARKRLEDELRHFNRQLERRVAERTAELSREVAERKQVEARLRTLWSAVEQSPLAVVITDKAGVIEHVNPAFVAQTGYTAAEAVGQNPRLLKSGVHPREFYEDLWQTVLAGRIWHSELCNRRKDGTQFWIATAIAPIRDDEGNLTHFVALQEDITERRRIAAELREAKEAADAANRAKSRFLANMSHEIRTPLNAILGFAQLLQRDPTLTPEQRKHLDTINRGGEHLLRLISDVLDMSKIESGRMQLTVAECDFRTLLADMEAMFRLRAEAQGLRFEVTCAAGVPIRLHTDAGKVRQVLLNVLGNAIKFTPRGDVRMHVASEPAPASAEAHAAARLCIEVADTGVGIPPQELEQVFEPFEQTRSGQSQGGGTGLGMAISRQLARVLGGALTVTSQVGVGSTFRFTFVAAVAEPAKAATPAAPARRGVRGLRPGGPAPLVLVADDSESNRQLLRRLLTRAGFAVREAVNGAEAVAVCRAERPALVLMDRWMPGLDGLAASLAIRADPAGRDVRILMVSGNVFDMPEAEWRAAGVDGFISKPFEIDDLLARIGALLGVEYAQDEPVAAPAAKPRLTRAAARLPATLRAEIRAATEAGDVARLRELIQQGVSPVDAAIGQALGDLVADFNYQAILSAFTEKESHD